jgi:hypothetical protein
LDREAAEESSAASAQEESEEDSPSKGYARQLAPSKAKSTFSVQAVGRCKCVGEDLSSCPPICRIVFG